MVTLGGCAKSPFYAVIPVVQPKSQASAKFSALPGGIFLAAAFVKGLGLPGESIEHGPDKFSQSGLTESVGFPDDRQAIGKVQRILVQAAEVLNIQSNQLHASTS